jgi:hypothetical protein
MRRLVIGRREACESNLLRRGYKFATPSNPLTQHNITTTTDRPPEQTLHLDTHFRTAHCAATAP